MRISDWSSDVCSSDLMYDPDASRLGRFAERGSGDDWLMFGYYVMNNIGIAFQTFASGLLFGLGTLFFLLFNGLTLGAVDRKSVVSGKRVSVRVDLGGSRFINKKYK